MLTIITPVYCRSKKDYIYNRVLFFIENSFISQDVKRIVVDFGSIPSVSSEFEKACNAAGIEYENLGMQGNPFSAGECRNKGVSLARTQYVTFQDVDLFAPDSIYEELINRVRDYQFYNEVECVPCLYLNDELSDLYFNKDSWCDIHDMIFKYYWEKNENITMYAPVTSMILINRRYLMECGGNNTEFYGHGYEDFELFNRVANRTNKFVRSRDYYNHSYSYDSPYYSGYRPYFSLFGRELMNEKIFFVHLKHPVDIIPGYSARNKTNQSIFNRLVRSFDDQNFMPAALSGFSAELKGKTLVFAAAQGKTVKSIRVAIPYLSQCIFKKDDEFSSSEELANFIASNNVTRVLFFNSYGNEHRLHLYNECIKFGVQTINYDRGGLPDTWFFDPNGFNATSSSYSPEKWDVELSENEIEDVSEYIIKTLSTSEALEKNGDRVGASNFIKKYNLENKNILFVPLQRPGDSVIKYFSDEVGDVDCFLKDILQLASMSTMDGWQIVIKKHPLEGELILEEITVPSNVTFLGDKDNFFDVIIASKAVMLINSGVGLYSLMAGKPTFNLGLAYYSHEGLSVKVKSVIDFINYIPIMPVPDVSKVYKFIHYLINDFYSIGSTVYKEYVDPDLKSKTTNAIYTDFKILRIPDLNGVMNNYFIDRRCNPFKINTVYYEYYRSSILLRDKSIAEIGNDNDVINGSRFIDASDDISNGTKVSLKNKCKRYGGLRRKFKKLIKNPILFFSDACKNIFSSKAALNE